MATRHFIFAVLGLALLVWPAFETRAGGLNGEICLAKITLPQPARGKGERCVADTDFMRRNHMDMLKHQRVGTVHDGVRTKQYQLKGCITCHAVDGADGTPVTIKDPKHFCRTCHDYAAVRIDCFECHASRPAPKARATLPPVHELGALTGYLAELKQ